jgi:hypothetical protein
MLTILIPLAIAVLGLLIFLLPTPPKWNEVGKLVFIIGFFWFVDDFAHSELIVTGPTYHHER